MRNELYYIKKHFGEKFSHLCRDNFSEILENEGALTKLITDHFLPSKELYLDLEKNGRIGDFVRYLKSQYSNEGKKITATKTPKELMALVGYHLYPECKTEADIQSFRPFYYREGPTPVYIGGRPAKHDGEELCTFSGERLKTCRVWFAVKDNADQIKRENFINPNRQDAYGTSVISIQFTRKEPSILSIKNRYNHSVSNSDATFGNNLDAIAEGLTDAFCKMYQIRLLDKDNLPLELEGYTQALDGKFYKYNFESGGAYFCPNNIIVDAGEVKVFSPERYLVFDRYVIDLQEKIVQAYFDIGTEGKSVFAEALENIEEIKRIPFSNGLMLKLTPADGEPIEIKLNKNNEIISYRNPNIEQIDQSFFYGCRSLVEADFPKLKKMERCCFYACPSLKKFSAPLLEEMEDYCFHTNQLVDANFPSLKTTGRFCFYSSPTMTKFSAHALETMGSSCLYHVPSLKEFDTPLLKQIKTSCLYENQLVEANLPSLESMDDHCFFDSPNLIKFSAPLINTIENLGSYCFWHRNKYLKMYLSNKDDDLKQKNERCSIDTQFQDNERA